MSAFQATSIREQVDWFALYDFAVEYALVVQSSRLFYFLGIVLVAVILAAEDLVEGVAVGVVRRAAGYRFRVGWHGGPAFNLARRGNVPSVRLVHFNPIRTSR